MNAIGMPRDLDFNLLPVNSKNRVAFFIIQFKGLPEGCTGMDLMLLDLSHSIQSNSFYLLVKGWMFDKTSHATTVIFA
jgi:hypothetical protein